MPKVSIIVPIYGVEPYLAQCVESLQNQTLSELEMILVDDGSPDNCGHLADAFARQDSRIRVIHQQNAGLGAARNAGLAAARGEYVAFVDGDDWVTPSMYEALYRAAKTAGAEIAVSGHRDMAYGKVLRVKQHPLAGKTLTGEAISVVRRKLYGHAPGDAGEAFPMSVCMSLYRREMVEKQNLQFRNLLSEDALFNLDAYGCARVITFTDGTDYCYRKEGQSSITQSFSRVKLGKYMEFLSTLASLAEKEDTDCILRAKRTAIDYGRLYAGQVEASSLPPAEKRESLRDFLRDPMISHCWADYPVETLPARQRIFHTLLQKEHFTAVLALACLRRKMKEGGMGIGKS